MEYTDVLLIGIIVGLVELVKYLGVPKKVLPVLALVLGVIGGIFYLFPDDLQAGILMGVVMGLAASGFYSSGKTVIKKDGGK